MSAIWGIANADEFTHLALMVEEFDLNLMYRPAEFLPREASSGLIAVARESGSLSYLFSIESVALPYRGRDDASRYLICASRDSAEAVNASTARNLRKSMPRCQLKIVRYEYAGDYKHKAIPHVGWLFRLERNARFELVTFGLGSRRSTN